MQRKHCPAVPRFVLTDRSNQELVEGARHLVGRHRTATAHLVAHLAEIHARKLHVAEGFSYLGDYCVSALGMSEDEAHRRAHAAVLAQKYPVILDMLLEGSIHLSTLRIIGRCLTPRNHEQVLAAARGKTKTQLEHLAAALCPKPDVPAVLRKLPQTRLETGEAGDTLLTGGKTETAEQRVVLGNAMEGQIVPGSAVQAPGGPGSGADLNGTQPSSEPELNHPSATLHGDLKPDLNGQANMAWRGLNLAPDLNTGSMLNLPVPAAVPAQPKSRLAPLSPHRYNLQVTVDEETYHALKQLQDLLRHQVRNGDLARIIKDALLERLEHVKREKFGHTKRPRKAREQESWIEAQGTVAGVNPKEPVVDAAKEKGTSPESAASGEGVEEGLVRANGEETLMETGENGATSGSLKGAGSGSIAPGRSRGQESVSIAPERSASSRGTDSGSIAPAQLAVNSRHIPAAVKREVWERDKGRCAFVSRSGRRCSERGRLEFHHIHAYALGGPATVENIALFCRTHNAHEGEKVFGENRPGKKVDSGGGRHSNGGSRADGSSTDSDRPGDDMDSSFWLKTALRCQSHFRSS